MSNSLIEQQKNRAIRVITICNADHLPVWKLTSKLLPEFVKADKYFVYVPENEVVLFSRVSDPRISVRSQGELAHEYRAILEQKILEANNISRFGWYLQQFFKLELIFDNDPKFDLTVIWDADCVPTRNIPILDTEGKLVYLSVANEFHGEYFTLIEKLLGMRKVVEMSFVIPGFPIFHRVAQNLRKELEKSFPQSDWYDILIQNINFELRSGLSETELLGTWVTNAYPNSWSVLNGTWERRGQKRFGYAKNMTVNKIIKIGKSYNLDIISFENWDTRGLRLILKRIKEKLLFLWNRRAE